MIRIVILVILLVVGVDLMIEDSSVANLIGSALLGFYVALSHWDDY